ncbi:MULTISPECIES: flagellar motor switch protein FliN [Bacillus cereus group]|uniref:Surface presentation of antigens (SPOA) protein n=1 Tax=Bacillus cytotoxicus (strain DSM 22905 / CIP 110041 / 391-98 / NVH 391-98) TaxID=315749 RepID=A7GNJ2_BACCN|nr:MULTISPECIES: flagellar motor switch protein FliN [Bacillus cereus group]ABS21700.1 surface presentation of antigens (SPOA) protein [Bacillus cytotoxicus NVH 391-98]AWC28316.1 flagellar motor switch protein [Bacillus cytotoxicus]AWC40299.1 flagellar motor switch protein [Bacillus cytotoxicus]AWC44398.1 flagellar motor switch protein [Bacillus cytotoxicus]AWC48230.1 flagellar motor switch protein [Bacillus cytotoxicus]
MKHEVSPVSLMSLEEYAIQREEQAKAHIDTVSDISIELGVKLGKASVQLGDVKNLKVGDVLEVEKNLGHKVDVYLSDIKVGIGEAIVMDEQFGIIISEIEADKKQAALLKAQRQVQEKE